MVQAVPKTKQRSIGKIKADLYNSPTIEITNAAADAIQTTAVAILVFEQSDIILYIFWLSDKGWMNAMKLYETYETVL